MNHKQQLNATIVGYYIILLYLIQQTHKKHKQIGQKYVVFSFYFFFFVQKTTCLQENVSRITVTSRVLGKYKFQTKSASNGRLLSHYKNARNKLN